MGQFSIEYQAIIRYNNHKTNDAFGFGIGEAWDVEQVITKDSYIKETFYRAMEQLLEKKDFKIRSESIIDLFNIDS